MSKNNTKILWKYQKNVSNETDYENEVGYCDSATANTLSHSQEIGYDWQ